MNFVAIDFETATNRRDSACAVGIVTVENGVIVDEYYTLIQPPKNEYLLWNIKVHGIKPKDTISSPSFLELYPKIKEKLYGKKIIAHNESFDRGVLKNTMEYYDLSYDDLNIPMHWECTCKIYKAKGFKPANLAACCSVLSIELNHHEALSDARACAKLYLAR